MYNLSVVRSVIATEFKSQRLTFEELDKRLREYEQRYGYSTIEFYRRFQSGELGDDDSLMMWSGLYYLCLTQLRKQVLYGGRNGYA